MSERGRSNGADDHEGLASAALFPGDTPGDTDGKPHAQGGETPRPHRWGRKRIWLTLLLVVAVVVALGVVLPLVLRSSGPDYLGLDDDTGLHITGTPTQVDISTYRLSVSGKVLREVALSYDEMLGLTPKITSSPDLVCPGYFVDKATWSGVPFKTVLDLAGIRADAAWVRMKAADGYTIKVELEVALAPGSFLAYELQGKRLPVSQGFPLRAVFPGQEGNRWVKWITELVVE